MTYISTEHQIFYVNSKNRISGTNSDFTYVLNIKPNNEYNRICVLQCLIPKSYYLVQQNQNTFTLTEDETDVNITLPIGNYSRKSMQRVLQTQLNNTSPHGWNYTITYPSSSSEADTGKFTFTVSGNGGTQPVFTFGEYLYEQLGFNSNSSNYFVNEILTSSNVIKLQREDTLFICSDICTGTNGKNAVLQEVFANGGSETFSNITFTCPDVQAYSKPFNGKGSNIFRFSVTDENFNQILLNGQNIVMSIVIYKDQNDMNKLLSEYIKLRAYQKTKK